MLQCTRRVLAALAALLIVFGAETAHADVTFDRWYVALLSGSRVGWMHSTETVEGDRITSNTHMRLVIKRGALEMAIELASAFEETDDGRPIRSRSKLTMSDVPQITELEFGEDGTITQRLSIGDQTTELEFDGPEEPWLAPVAAQRFVEKRLRAGAEKITFNTIDPSQGPTIVRINREIVGPTTVEAMGKTVPALEWVVTTSVQPGITTTEYVDPETGDMIRSVVDLGVIRLDLLAADKALAMAEAQPVELMERTFVTPDKPIRRPRLTRQASYIITIDGDADIAPAAAGGQQVEALGDGRFRVTIDFENPVDASGDPDIEHALRASTFINSEDELITKLAAKATKNASDDPFDRAEAIRRFVYKYIDSKDLGVGFASASETARSRQGDCSEHGVLAAAIMRASGIPARVASGLIYADQFLDQKGIFGYHMWTQALVPDENGVLRWHDFDAAWPNRMDATHIMLRTSVMGDDAPLTNDIVDLVPMIGRLSIEVESIN
jgi:hypothetical protein